MKISIIGLGRVGSAIALVTVMKALADELVLVDRDLGRARGDAADLLHGTSFTPLAAEIHAGEIPDTAGSDIIVLAASIPAAGVDRREVFLAANAALLRELVPPLAAASPNAIFLVVTNPLDVMTYLTLKLSGFPPTKVLGTGTLIDTGRFRALLAHEEGIHPNDLRAYIVGEHGDSQFPVLSLATAGGARFQVPESRVRQLFDQARLGGQDVIRHKGYTNFAVAMATGMILETIAHNTRSVLPVSVLVDGFHGVSGVCLSIPCVVGRAGVLKTLKIEMDAHEAQLFEQSAQRVREMIRAVGMA